MVAITFNVRDDLQVDARLGQDLPVFDEALGDSISSLPPRGAPGIGPSTYWIDEAERGAVRAHEAADGRPFLWGNVTVLSIRGDNVIAKLDFAKDDEPGDAMPLAEFLDMLAEWRQRVQQSASGATGPLPETYRRNPLPDRP